MKTKIMLLSALFVLAGSSAAFAAEEWGPESSDTSFSDPTVFNSEDVWGPEETDATFADPAVWLPETRTTDCTEPSDDSSSGDDASSPA